MYRLKLLLLLVLVATTAHAKIYKWVDENGSIHFSDKPYSSEAEEVKVDATGITVDSEGEETATKEQSIKSATKSLGTKEDDLKKKVSDELREITEDDYKITSSVGKLGADVMSISGRISAGPICKDMTVTADASNENGLSASITVQVSKTNSYGSTTFEGNDKVAGSAEDFSFWQVDSVTVRCND